MAVATKAGGSMCIQHGSSGLLYPCAGNEQHCTPNPGHTQGTSYYVLQFGIFVCTQCSGVQ